VCIFFPFLHIPSICGLQLKELWSEELWSEFLATDLEARVQFLALPDFLRIVGLEWGPLSFGLERREYSCRDPSHLPHGTLYLQKLALTSPASGGHSVGIVRSWTQATEFVLFACDVSDTSLVNTRL
jgi:hypothetical protein